MLNRWWVWALALMCVCGFACGQTGLPDSVKNELVPANKIPTGNYVFARGWDVVKGSGHMAGHAVDDAQATDGKAWEARAGIDSHALALIYGPYIDLEPGNYVAFVRAKLLEEVGDERIADIDTCVGYGQTVLAAREVLGSDMALDRYVQIPLPFHYDLGKLECRLTWKGYTSLRIDRISLYKLEGGNLTGNFGRAPEAVKSGLPKNLADKSEPRPFPEIFPRSAPPAKTLNVVDLRKEQPDRQMMALTLQGLVNRKIPEVYAVYTDIDNFWLTRMQQRKWIDATKSITVDEMLARYKSRFKGVVIVDPQLPASKNVAQMIASVRDGIVVSPRIAKTLNLPVLDDLRGRWKTSVEAYKWSFDNLWPKLNHHVIACSYPDHLGLRDYLTQNRVFTFWLSGPIDGARAYGSPTGEVKLMEQLLAKMPTNIPVMSYPWASKDVGIGEGPGVTLFAEFAKYLVGSIDATNLSVHTGIRIAKLTQRKAPPVPKLDHSKIYVSWIMSDGDNVPVLTTSNFPQLWLEKARGQIPMGWTITPSSIMLVPDVADYFYSTATDNDAFLTAVSGIGYTYADFYANRYKQPDRQRLYDGFLKQTSDYMKKMDLKDIWIMNATQPAIIRRYAEQIPWLDAIFPDYGRRVSGYDDATYPSANGIPVFHALSGWVETSTHEEKIAGFVAELKAMTPKERPAFMHAFIWNWGAEMDIYPEVMRRLGPDYVAVRPDHLAALCRQDMATRKVLVRAPTTISSIEGKLTGFNVRVTNVTKSPITVSAKTTSGVKVPFVGKAATVAKDGTADFHIPCSPIANNLGISVATPFGAQTVNVGVTSIPIAEIDGKLPEGELRFIKRFDTTQLGHITGHSATDPSEAVRTIWVAERNVDKPSAHMQFGPYADLKAGRYVVLFRLKRTDDGVGEVALIDEGIAGGKSKMVERHIDASALPVGEWRRFAIVFDHPGGQYEARVYWTGAASLAADCLETFEVAK